MSEDIYTIDILASMHIEPILEEYKEKAKSLPENALIPTEELMNDIFLLAKQCFQLGLIIGMRNRNERLTVIRKSRPTSQGRQL
jgi:hypothetical protein